MEKTKRQINREFCIGIAFAIGLVLANLLFEHSPIGMAFERWGDLLFQGSLRPSSMPDVVVLNVAGMPPSSTNAEITSRDSLRDLVRAVAALSPRAIAIDIDMSPRDGLYADPVKDPGFFSGLLTIANKIPIYVAVFKSMNSPVQYWLGSARFEKLAASAALFPNSDNRTIPASIAVGADCGRTLSAAAAGVTVDCHRRANFFTFAQPETQWRVDEYNGQEYVVNYSVMRDLIETHIDAPRAAAIIPEDRPRFYKKVVFLGDMGPPDDPAGVQDHCTVPVGTGVPGYPDSDVPCVLVQAEGTYTLMQSGLLRITPQARLALDIVLAGLVLGIVWALRRHYECKRGTHVRIAAERLYTTGFVAFALAIVIACGFLSRMTRIVWDDYILIALVLVFHRQIERVCTRSYDWLRLNLKKFVFEEQASK